MKFTKMESLLNDFIIIENSELLSKDQVAYLCDRRKGIGADQLIIIQEDGKVFFYNQDGSVANACGNGSRSIIKYLADKYPDRSEFKLTIHKNHNKTMDEYYSIFGSIKGDLVEMELDYPKIIGEIKILDLDFVMIDCRNMHLVSFDDVEDYEYIGRSINQSEQFPDGINVNFAKVIGDGEISLVTYERGAGVTPACGSGSLAVAYLYYKNTGAKNIKISNKGGDIFFQLMDNKIISLAKTNKCFEGVVCQELIK